MEEHYTGDGFTYTYSAREQEEVKRIREKYVTKRMIKWSGSGSWTGT